MSNMSYCRFENTYRDLRDCYIAIKNESNDEDDKLSRSEQRYKDQLIELCQEISEYIEYDEQND